MSEQKLRVGVVGTLSYGRWRFLEDGEEFWRMCLKVARSKPYLCAEAVESEAMLIILGLKPEPEDRGKET